MDKVKRTFLNSLKTIALPLAMYLLLAIVAKMVGRSFGSWMQVTSVAMQSARPLILTFGICFAMKSGRMDFACGAVTTFIAMSCSIVACKVLDLEGLTGLVVFVLMCVTLGALLGLINGFVYITLKVPGIVCTLGLCMIYETLSYIVSGGNSVTISDYTMMYFGRAPGIYFIMIFAAILFYIIWSKTYIGYHVRAVGSGQIMARNVGVKVKKLSLTSFVCSGIFYGLCAVVYQSFSGTLNQATNFATAALMFDGVIALIVANFLSRYCSMPIACFFAAITFRLLTAGLVAIGLQAEFQEIFKGIFIILFTFFTSQGKRFEKKKHDKERIAKVQANASSVA